MKLLLKLSLATALFSSVLGALSVNEFITNNKVLSLAPHLVQEISTQGIETFSGMDVPAITAGLKIPLLDDIVQVVSLNIFNGNGADWSRLEAAKLKAIQESGAEALKAAADLTEVDIRQASLIMNAIYDAVIAIPATTKETYNARIQAQAQAKTPEEAKTQETKPEAKELKKDIISSIWDALGFSLMKSQDTVKKAKSLLEPSNVCETTDTAYLKGVEEVVYYSSLTHGLAGGALATAPPDSPLKSLDLKTIISSVGKLAVEIQMIQSVARLADLDPASPIIRAMAFLSLSADSASAQAAQTARDLHNLINYGIAELIPESVIRALSEQAALVLITRGAGQSSTVSVFDAVPVLRNVLAFSNEVLNANNIGDVVKFVFCPQSSREAPSEPGKEEETGAQKVLRVPTEAGQKVAEKDNVDATQDKAKEKANQAADKSADMKNASEDKAKAEDKEADEKKTAVTKSTDKKTDGAKGATEATTTVSEMAEETDKAREQPKKEDTKEEL